jgi:hypothetical protein
MQALGNPSFSGETGFLAEENAQRLLSIFLEAGMSCLTQLSSVVEVQLKAKALDDKNFLKFYRSGLMSIAQWPAGMLRAEISDLEAHYPELQKLHQYVVVSILSEATYASALSTWAVPPLEDAYHGFLKRLVAEVDVQRGAAFLEMPLIYRKVVFVQAFRNAYHDLCQKYTPAAPSPERKPLGLQQREEDKDAAVLEDAQSCASGQARKPSSLFEAMEVVSHRTTLRNAVEPSVKDGSKKVFLHNSPATLHQDDEKPPEGVDDKQQTALQKGINCLQLVDKADKESLASC